MKICNFLTFLARSIRTESFYEMVIVEGWEVDFDIDWYL